MKSGDFSDIKKADDTDIVCRDRGRYQEDRGHGDSGDASDRGGLNRAGW